VPEQFEKELVQGIAIPPAVHVGFAQGQGPAGGNPVEEATVADGDIPGAVAVDLDVSLGEKVGEEMLA